MHDDNNIAIPFECADYYGRTALCFSTENPPSGKHQTRIANAYYNRLLGDPDNLVDYENRMYDSMSGEWIAFGVCHGQPYMDAE